MSFAADEEKLRVRSRAILGTHLRTLREAQGLTLRQVQERTGIGAGTLSNIERGKSNPRFDTVTKLARLYDREVCEITAHPHGEPCERLVAAARGKPKQVTDRALAVLGEYPVPAEFMLRLQEIVAPRKRGRRRPR